MTVEEKIENLQKERGEMMNSIVSLKAQIVALELALEDAESEIRRLKVAAFPDHGAPA